MSHKHVVLRTSTNNRRKNTDGDRSDSGCFEDVDVLQMATRPCRTSASSPTKSLPIPDGQLNEKTDQCNGNDRRSTGNDRRSTGNDDIPTETPSNPDECAEDTEFLAIMERLSEVTKNPGDLYRLCFSSRMSFCGLDLGGIEDEGSLPPPEDTSRGNDTDNTFVSGDISAAQSNTAVQTRTEPDALIREAGDAVVEHRNCENREECVQLLSLLSSFVKKAKEKPAVFNQSGLGRSLFGQLSSLLTTLEEAKENPNFSSSGVQPERLEPEQPERILPARVYNLNTARVYNLNALPLQPPAFGGNTDSLMPEQHTGCNSEKEPSVLLPSDFTDDATVALPVLDDVTESMVSHNNEESPPQIRHQDGDHVLRTDVENVENTSDGEQSGEQSGNVVTSGRRAVTPYSWDYGDIWEKELQRAQSTDSFPPERCGEPGSNMPGDPLMPTFEEIRDELFHDAGFGRGNRVVASKPRSRSADARSSDPFRNEPSWPACEDQDAGHSPFVRTVYQKGFYPNTRLTRSGSSLLSEQRSMTINLDRNQGRQVRVYPESPNDPRSGQLDDSLALIVKEDVTGTSTFRGPKPWSMLTRRPSGLGRHSNSAASSETLRSTEFPRTRLDSHGDSESSDSPNYVSTASSDCLTTDDSSSLTSSHYCAASSAQSSPTVSNRNSACFSDTGSSEHNDLRRVVFQESSPELYPWDKYPRDKYPVDCGSRMRDRFFADDANRSRMERWDVSLDQRFGRIGRSSRASSEPSDSRLNTKNHQRKSYQRAENYRGGDPSALRNLQHNAAMKWSRERSMSPLIVRSDSDLNHLARVQFVGDSYSRSHISKNLRYARQTSRSPSPCARSAHARVLSCEIVQSDKDKRDVYTKVNLSRSVHDEETAVDDPNPRSGGDGTRRSWHGRSPQRGFSRSLHANGSPRRVQSEKYAFTAGLVDRRRQVFRPQKSEQEDQPVHATLVEVKNIRGNHMRSYHSTGGCPPSRDSDASRHWSEFRAPAHERGESYDNSRQFPRNPMTSRNGRADVNLDGPANARLGPNCRRMRADQAAASSSQPSASEKKEMVHPCRRQEGSQNVISLSGAPENTREKDRKSPVKTGNGSKGNSKEHATHIVKETSFVGPSTFTKYQSPSNPSPARMRRSKSLNEKDIPSRRRAQQSEAYRRKVLEMANDDADAATATSPDLHLPSESDHGVVLRPERTRRHSEGSWRPSGSGDSPTACVVDESYCDPRRESIREGTYSISSAESARVATKSGGGCLETPPTKTPPAKDGENNIMPDRFQKPEKENNAGRSSLEKEREDGNNKNDPGKRLFKDNVELERKGVYHKDIEQMELSCKVQAMKLNCIGKRDNKNGENTSPKAPAVSPVWRAKEEPESTNGVNVFIDYRSKRPVSVEYEVAESRPEHLSKTSKLGLLKKCKANAKQSTKDKPSEAKSQAAYVVEDLQPALVPDVNHKSNDSAEEFPRKRLSRKEKHMLDISPSFVQVYENETKPCEDFKVLPEPSSPVPYRRDKTIVYTDARLSVDSDTDSISHDSTVSSSGSDVTVILNDDTDITADDFKQLAQNGSEIGIEIGSLEVDSDDFPESPESTPEKNGADTAAWTRLDGSFRNGSEVVATNFSGLSRSSKELTNKGSFTRVSRDPGNKASFANKEIGNSRSFVCSPKGTSSIPSFAHSLKETGSNRSFAHSLKETGNSRTFAQSPKETVNNRNFSIPPKQTGNNRGFASPPKETGNNQGFAFSPKETGDDGKIAEPFKQGSKLRDIYLKYEQSVGETHSTAGQKNATLPTNTSLQECGKESGTSSSECSKGKHSSTKTGEGGKGLFSKLKNIRNSFRGKKTEGKCAEKSGKSSKHSSKKAGKTPDIRHNLGSRSLPIFDSNSNEMCDGSYEVPKLADRTNSIDFSTQGSSNEELTLKGELFRTVNENTLRNVGGLLSVSSDQLNSLRIKIPSKKAAKSLEVLLETCI